MTGKLTLLRCQACGGEVKVLTADELQCLYCGNVYTLLGAGLVPLGQEQPMYLSEPVPQEGYYWLEPEWIMSGFNSDQESRVVAGICEVNCCPTVGSAGEVG